jgi:phospholipid/cholesterol/gamma-HCH transport system ATP-binding protein
MALQPTDAIIRVRDITVQFGSTRVLDGLNLDASEILGFVGPSGAGKSVLTRTIIGLVPKTLAYRGVRHDLDAAVRERRGVERRWGICFSRARCFHRSRCGRTSSFRCAKISCSPTP